MASAAGRLPFDPIRVDLRAAGSIAWQHLASRRFLVTLAAVWIVASGLAGLDLAYRYAALDGTRLPGWFDLSQDGALGEIYEYSLALAASAGLALAARREGSALFATLAAVFAWTGLDNALLLHERLGAMLGAPFAVAPQWGLEAKDLGEVLAFGLTGAAMLAGLAASFPRSGVRERAQAATIVLMIGVAALFAVGIDLIHAAVRLHSPLFNHAATFIEEFGELASFSAAAAFSLTLREA